MLSRSVDGDVIRKKPNDKDARATTSSNDDYITESSLNEKPTDSSIYYDNNNDKSEVKHKPNGNKINLDFEPQPPNYAEAVPSVVDSKGGVHYTLDGIVDELPGVLSNNDNHRAKNLNVYVKPLNGNLGTNLQTNSFDVYSSSNGNIQLDKDLALLERRSRKLFRDEDNRRNQNDNNNSQNQNNNQNNGYQYVPVITPEKLLFQTTRNPFDIDFRSTQRHKNNNGLSRSSASRPRGRVIYADFDEDERQPKIIENERQPKLLNHNNNNNNNNNNNSPIEAEVEALLHNLNQPSARDNLHHISINHNNRSSNNNAFDHHFVNNNNNNNNHHTTASNFKNNINKQNNQQSLFNPNAEIIVVPIRRTPQSNSNSNRNKPIVTNSNNQLNNNVSPSNSQQQSNRNRNHQSNNNNSNNNNSNNRNREVIRHPRLEPGPLAPGNNGFIGVIFDDEDPSYNEQPVSITPPIVETERNPPESNSRTRSKQQRNEDQSLINHQTHHHNPQSPSIQSTTPLTIVPHNHESLRNSKPDWTPVVIENSFGTRDNKEAISDNYNPSSIFEHERNTLPQPTVKPLTRQQQQNRQRQNANQQRTSSRNAYQQPILTTTTTTTTTEPSTMRTWQQVTSTSRPSRISGSAAIANSAQNGPAGRRKSNKRLIVKAKNILDSPPQLASRPPAIYETPIGGSQAKKCDRNVCRLPGNISIN